MNTIRPILVLIICWQFVCCTTKTTTVTAPDGTVTTTTTKKADKAALRFGGKVVRNVGAAYLNGQIR